MATTSAMIPHTVVPSEPPMSIYAPLPNGSSQHSLPNPTQAYATHNTTPPNIGSSNAVYDQSILGVESLREEMFEMFRQTFGRDPRVRTKTYQKPYPLTYECVNFPQGFRIPEFTKFTGDDNRTTLEHIAQFVIQCGEASYSDIYKIRLFPLSLSGAAFTWFSSLPPNSIRSWPDLEQKFHDYFFTGESELKLSYLTSV